MARKTTDSPKSVSGKFYQERGYSISVHADRVYLLAEKRYMEGGDVIVECWTPKEIDADIKNLREARIVMDIADDKQEDARIRRESA